MFKNKQFYHQTTKKAIVAFGTIFNDINIDRFNSGGDIVQTMRVPLAYSSKQKFLSRILNAPDTTSRGGVAITLPRMGFEITGFNYDASRKISPIQQNKAISSDSQTSVRQTFVSTPYDISLSLYVFAKNQEDGLQIIEQILPYFNPDFNVTVNDLPQMGIKRDIKITLESVSYEDQYEGDYNTRQSIVWTLNFAMKLNYYGFVSNQGLIKKAIATTWQSPLLTGEYLKQTYTVTTPTATATAALTGGSVSSIELTYSGDKYTYTPNVIVSAPSSGTTARATAIMDGERISRIDVTNGGSGYTTVPTITIEGPDGTVSDPTPADPYRFLEEFEQDYE